MEVPLGEMRGASSLRRLQLGLGVKLGCDVLIAAIILVLVAPLMVLIALCVFLDSPGPIFYRGRRVGYRGERLHILKFRKMHHGAAGRSLTLGDDERFTGIGRWLARTKLDELPQLINVLRGEMSLIGPRPEDPDFVRRHAEEFQPILRVRPGITGLSQLAFVNEGRILDPNDPIRHYEERILPQKLRIDGLYVTRWRLRLDVQILCWTLAAILLRIPVAVNRSTGRMTVRRGRRREYPAVARAPWTPDLNNAHRPGSWALPWQDQNLATDGASFLGLRPQSVTERVAPAAASAVQDSADLSAPG
jgi:lipopolysaccharide/colanic/teichoic acid biosynthesis glycosyltransferase